MGRGFCLAELSNCAELDQLELELWLNWSLEDFPGWVGVQWGKAGNKAKAQLQLRLGLS